MDRNKEIISEFTDEIKRRCCERIKKIILFGSRARKDYREDSDFDFFIVVDKKDASIREEISRIAADLGEKHSVLITPLIRSEEIYIKSINSPLQSLIQEEGILL